MLPLANLAAALDGILVVPRQSEQYSVVACPTDVLLAVHVRLSRKLQHLDEEAVSRRLNVLGRILSGPNLSCRLICVYFLLRLAVPSPVAE